MSKRPTAPQSAPIRMTSVIPVFVHPKWVMSRLGLLAWHTLAGLAKKGHEIRAIAPYPEQGKGNLASSITAFDGRLVIEYVDVKAGKSGVSGVSGVAFEGNPGRVISNSIAHDSQLLLCQGGYSPMTTSVIESLRGNKIPYAVHLHSELSQADLKGRGFFGSRQVKKTWEPYLLNADTVMVPSEIQQKWINDWNWQVGTSVVPSGLEISLLDQDLPKVLAKPYYVIHGELTQGFDYGTIVEAFSLIEKAPESLKLVFLGKDPHGLFNLIKQQAVKYGVGQRVLFLSSEDFDKRLSVLISAAAIFPCLIGQHMTPVSVSEASCLQKPCVLLGQTEEPLIHEAVNSGAAQLVPTVRSELTAIFEKVTFDQAFRHTLTRNARSWHKQFVNSENVFNLMVTALRKMTLRAS